MACPYFVPVEPWTANGDGWTGPRRVPLGEPYRGICSCTAAEIGEVEQRKICNFGYARSRCRHFPETATVDAVRFSMTNPGELIWIAERDHSPVAHGTNSNSPPEYSALKQAFVRSYESGKCPQGIRS